MISRSRKGDSRVREETKDDLALRESSYSVRGMRCASCEILIEKKLLAMEGVKSVEADASKGKVVVEYLGERPDVGKLNRIFEKENYVFLGKQIKEKKDSFISVLGVFLITIVLFLFLSKSSVPSLVNVNSKSSLPAFFFLGLVAGVSGCVGLAGGLVLSMSKQWASLYGHRQSTFEKLQPHFMFNIGRIVSYAFFGALLGFLGDTLQVSFRFSSILVIFISFLMIVLAFQMLEIDFFRKFNISFPRFITRYVTDETNFKGRYVPFFMGALTFFLPCGFTFTAQGLALISGSTILGGLMMFIFALGTLPSLLAIGVSAASFSSNPQFSRKFSRVAGVLVLSLALFNINNQLNVLGYSSFENFFHQNTKINSKVTSEGLAPLVDGKQVLKMDALSSGYFPDYFKVRVGIPVKWEIADKGTSACTNAIVSSDLFSGQILLSPGKVSVKEFTPQNIGKYKFSCWMGMASGVIEVVD